MPKIPYPNWTAVPNRIFELLPELTESEVKVALSIVRLTEGWHKREITVSLAAISSIVGLSRGSCCDAIRGLEARELIVKELNTGSDGGCSASTYSLNLESPPCSATETTPFALDAHPQSSQPNAIRNKENKSKEKELIPPTPLSVSDSELDLEDPIDVFVVNSTRRTLGIRIKPKAWQERWESAEGKIGAEYLRRYWMNFLEHYRTHRKEIEVPQAYFLKNPERWDVGDETLQDAPQPTASPDTPTAPPADPPAPRVDYLARWNQLVPAAKTEVDTGSKAVTALREAEADPEFRSNFEEVCGVALKIRSVDPSATWLDFYWILRAKVGSSRKGWRRLLTDMRGMGEMSRPGQSGPGLDEAAKKRILDSMRTKDEEDDDAEN